MKFKILDYVAITLVVLLVSFITFFSFKASGIAREVHIRTPTKQYIYSLDKDNTIDLQGLKGKTRISIKDGKVKILASPCPLKICMKNGTIANVGEWLVCLPNGIIVNIKGKDDENKNIDAFSE